MEQDSAARDSADQGLGIAGLEGISAADIRYLIDRQAILDCIRRYARGVDRHDEELMASAFWPDAQINYGSWSGPPHLFTPWANAGHDSRYLSHVHNITTQTADIDGDVAHVESYIAYFLRETDEQHVRVGIGRYIERYERRGREWRIAVREFPGRCRLSRRCHGIPEAFPRQPAGGAGSQRPFLCPSAGAQAGPGPAAEPAGSRLT